jgi:hypothetical protein
VPLSRRRCESDHLPGEIDPGVVFERVHESKPKE